MVCVLNKNKCVQAEFFYHNFSKCHDCFQQNSQKNDRKTRNVWEVVQRKMWKPRETDFHVFVDFRSSMPRNINLEELKAKFSGLRPALRPASPGQQSPNMDLIAELKSNNWSASLKKTKKKKQGEENKVRAKFVLYLHNETA